MLADNRIILKRKNINTYNRLIKIENEKTKSVVVSSSKSGDDTLILTIGELDYSIHSKYNPKQEAKTLIEKYKNLSNQKHVLFIGTGLGYHIELLLENNPHLSFSIFEPNLEILNVFLNRINLKKYKEDKIIDIFTSVDEINNINEFIEIFGKSSIVIELPIYSQLFNSEINEFHLRIKDALNKKKLSLVVDVSFQERWITNAIINFSEVINTPNFFTDIKSDILRNKPIILVSAGPSLSYEIENLRKIKNEGRAYIFAVGSAVNALIESNILPDAFFSYDPTALNERVAERIKSKQLSIPLIFGSTIANEVLKNYPGKKIHFLTNQDSFSHYLLGVDTSNTVPDATSIAVITLYILLKLEVQTIILVGQNLGYYDNKRYANEINYDFVSTELNELEKSNLLLIESVEGETIETTEGFLQMRNDLEVIIKNFNTQSEIINTTKHGAAIHGTKFMHLDKVIENKLLEPNIVTNEWLEGERKIQSKEILMKFKELEKCFDEMFLAFKEASEIQNEIIEDYQKNIFSKLDSQFNRFDRAFNKLERSLFFTLIIGPATRVQYKEFVRRSHEVKAARLSKQKVEKFIDIFVRYMRTILVTIATIQPAFKQLKESGIFNVKENVK